MPDAKEPNPPEAPDIRRSVHLRPEQWIGIPILIAIPLAALLGLFGESRSTTRVATSELAIEVEYPTRYRYKMLNSIRIDVTNTTEDVLDTVVVALDTVYASRFSTVVGIPNFTHPYSIELVDLPPGESRRIRIELQGEHYGLHAGELHVGSSAPDTARLWMSTFIFP